jgi:molybdopterin-guanine dinucleotide biosynthesis protein A
MSQTFSLLDPECERGMGAPDVSGVLMAGGRSRRMGRDKACLLWQGEFLWQRQLRVLRETGVGHLWIAGPREGPWAESPAVSVVEDAIPGGGPLAGLVGAFNAMTGDWLVVLAVDMPGMESAYLARLLACARSSGGGCVPFWRDACEPLAAVYPRALGELARTRLAQNRLSLQDWVREAAAAGFVAPHAIEPPSRRLFQNLNTPEDMRDAESGLEEPPDPAGSRETPQAGG